MAAPNLVWNSLGLTELHADRNVFENLEIDELIKRGLSKHKDGEYRESISIFSKALALCQSQFNFRKHVCATIHQYRADSHLQQNEYRKALNDVSESFRFSNNSLEIHVIAGKALTAYGNYDGAYIEYIRAYSRAVLFEKWRIVEVFQEFTTFFGHLPENLRNTFMTRTRLYMGEHANNWLSVCHHNVTKKDWKKAKMAYLQFKEYQLRPLESMKFDLKPFCNIREIKGNCWIADIIFHLIKCGSDKTELSLEEGDTYLHAAVRISVVSGHPQLIKYLVENESEAEVVSKPMVDSHGNTLLHVATKERNVNKKDRNEVMAIVLEYGVDPYIRDTNGRLAISYLSDDKSKNLIRTFLKAKEIKEKSNTQDVRVMTRNKIPTGKTRRKKKKAEERKIDSTCEKCQQIYNEAVSLLQKNKLDGLQLYIKLFNIDHSNEQHSRLVQDALKEFVEYIEKLNETDIHACMEGLCEGKVFLVIESIATFQKWTLLDVIHKYLKHRLDDKALKELCSKFSLDSYSKNISQTEEEVNIRIVNNLLDCGWCLGKDNGRILMQTAIDFKQFKFAVELFNHGMDLSFLTVYKGDTPIHAAIEIAMQEKQPSFLKGLLGKFKSDEKSYPYLNPEQLDMDGHSVLHLVTKSSDSDLVMQLTQILNEMGISANNHNVDINASKIGNLNAQSKPMESKGHSEIAHTSSSLSSRNKSSSIPSENPEQIKRRINDLMTSLPCNIQDTPIQKQANDKNIEVKMIDKQEHNVNTFKHEIPLKTVAKGVCTEVDYPPNKHNKARNKTLEDIATSVCFASKKDDSFDNDTKLEAMDEDDVDFSDLPSLESNEDIKEKTEHNTDVDVDMTTCKEDENISDKAVDEYDSLNQESSFEDLTWEVEYTDKVRKILESKHIEPQLKLKILGIFRRLAVGDLQDSFCKGLEIGPHNFDLFEVYLSSGSRITWEKAINFSPRYNDNAACSLIHPNDNVTEVQEDRIYTEVIRVWDIVIDHKKIKRSVKHIINAHRRGEKSLVQRKLKGLKINDERRKGNYPLLFTSNCKQDFISGIDEVQVRQYFPPASSNKTDYNILKFYTWDGALERYFLHGGKNNIEFPFKVTEKEDAIIRLNDKGPILLLGRSGTGKTTCCLFRLWNEYKNHLLQVEKNIEREEGQSEGNHESCENVEKQGAAYEQFHQLFLTKNYVLAAEVKKTFGGFLDTYDCKQNNLPQEHEKPLPYRFEDLTNSSFPLFLASRQFLCTLDASIGNPFFSRKEDGSLKYPVEGWADEEEFKALDILDFDSSDEETAVGDDFYPDESRGRQQKSYGDIRKEVTFETFENLIWPKLESQVDTNTIPR